MNHFPQHLQLILANQSQIAQLLVWFNTEAATRAWAGPKVHYPLILSQLIEDINDTQSQDYALVDEKGQLKGFGQILSRFGNQHLGRIVVNPKYRGQGIGHQLVTRLLTKTNPAFTRSLLVYKDNLAALQLYQKLGFQRTLPPNDEVLPENCIFMIYHPTI
ncbi:GNAT family N-acetyltransferase [Aliikangiella maris]|uniref:GNAT family N-acetyltransferase n=2 Tax=Aliikangiella maris TaxID=3162458 RepID=A0ABV3MJ97_9GAMM